MKNYLLLFDRKKNLDLSDAGLLVLRVGIGLLMALGHGWAKLSNFSAYSERFADPYGLGATLSLVLAIFAEFFCSLLIALGLFTRLATIPVIITMLTAVFIIHADDPYQKQELGLMYLIPLVSILIMGAGKYSFDSMFVKKEKTV